MCNNKLFVITLQSYATQLGFVSQSISQERLMFIRSNLVGPVLSKLLIKSSEMPLSVVVSLVLCHFIVSYFNLF